MPDAYSIAPIKPSPRPFPREKGNHNKKAFPNRDQAYREAPLFPGNLFPDPVFSFLYILPLFLCKFRFVADHQHYSFMLVNIFHITSVGAQKRFVIQPVPCSGVKTPYP